ncbi:hypothetical protein NODU109028_08255 [Nocardioides dubius]|uniref:PknH-like extracellular domain-containing protein n=1 Tax=Nocardioides dubius TaxID=317019 RepID=A0ABP4EFZ7_9ACTN
MNRVVGLVAAGALGAVLLTPSGPAHAAVPDSAFPSVGQVAKVYPAFAGGTRQTAPESTLFLTNTRCITSSMLAAKSGSVAMYSHTEQTPQTPTVWVVNFATKKKAQQAVTLSRKFARACADFDGGEVAMKVAKMSTPKLGDDRFAYRRSTISGGSTTRDAQLIVRKGRKVVVLNLYSTSKINATKFLALGKVAYKRAT